MRQWNVVREKTSTHLLTLRLKDYGEEGDDEISIKWDGCCEFSNVDHICDLFEFVKELEAIHTIGAQYFCDDGKKPEYGICGVPPEEVATEIVKTQARLNALIVS